MTNDNTDRDAKMDIAALGVLANRDALLARAEAAEAERDDLSTHLDEMYGSLHDAEAKVARVEALISKWNKEAHRYRIYAKGSSLPEMHHAIAKTLYGNADSLAAALDGETDA